HTLSLHDALPICAGGGGSRARQTHRILRRTRLPCQGEVRDACLAHTARGVGGERQGTGSHGVKELRKSSAGVSPASGREKIETNVPTCGTLRAGVPRN